jgi:type II secretory pathway component PulF
LRESLARVEACVREGEPLSQALGREEGLFSAVTIGLVRAGERGVGLATGLSHASADLERRAERSGRVRAALAYPVVLLSAGSVSLAAIFVLVVPRFAALLADVQAVLPFSTRLLLGTSLAVREHLLALCVFCLLGLSAVGALVGRQRGSWHRWLLATPYLGPLRHMLASARCARTLGALLESGTPALSALRVSAQTVGDAAVASRLESAAERVAQGASLSHALAAEHAFSPLILQLAAIGDAAGHLPNLLLRAADIEEQRAEQQLRAAVSVIEPAVVVAFAAAVAFVASALLQAIYSVRPSGL